MSAMNIYSTGGPFTTLTQTYLKWQSTPVLLPGKSHGQSSQVGYSPWGRKSRTQLSDFTFTFKYMRDLPQFLTGC